MPRTCRAPARPTALVCCAPTPPPQQLQAGIQALEARRGLLGDAVVDVSMAGLARLALAEGDAAAALAALRPLLDHVEAGGTLDGTNDRRLIELTCHQALARAGDPRAADGPDRAHAALMVQVETFNDAASRQGYLHNIPHHREVVAAPDSG